MDKQKQNDKAYKIMTSIFKILIALILITGIIIIIVNRKIDKQKEQLANAKLPVISDRIDKLIDANPDIYTIKTYFEYKGINYIEVYVEDTWFYTADIGKKRLTSDIRDNIKTILWEEGFIKSNDRLGIYIYSYDGMLLAESNMRGEIELKD